MTTGCHSYQQQTLHLEDFSRLTSKLIHLVRGNSNIYTRNINIQDKEMVSSTKKISQS